MITSISTTNLSQTRLRSINTIPLYFNLTTWTWMHAISQLDSTKFLFSTMRSPCETTKSYVTIELFAHIRFSDCFAGIQKFGNGSWEKFLFATKNIWQTWRVATSVATVYNGDVIISIPRTTCRKAARNVHAMPVYTRVISAGKHRYGIHKPQGESYALSE